MHNDEHDEGVGGSGWSINNTNIPLMGASASQDLFSMLTPDRSINSLASSATGPPSSITHQFLLPSISYNEILRGLTAQYCQPGPSTSSAPLNPILLQQDLIVQQHLQSLLGQGVSVQSSPSIASSYNFDTHSTNSGVIRGKKRSIAETRRTSLPPTSFKTDPIPCCSTHNGFHLPSELKMDIPLTDSPPSEERREEEQQSAAEKKEAFEEFRRRPAPVIPDAYPRAPTPEDYGQLSEANYIPSHFFRGTKLVLPDGKKKTVENLRSDDFAVCAASADDVLMQTSSIDGIEKNSLFYRLTIGAGFARETIKMEVSPDQPFFVLGKGWSSCDPRKTRETYGLDARLVQAGDVCISLVSCEFQSEETARALRAIVEPREAAVEALEEAAKYNSYRKAVKKLPKKSKKSRMKERRRRCEGRLSEPPPDLPSPRRRRRNKRSRSVDPRLLASPPSSPTHFHNKDGANTDYPNLHAFDFNI